MVGDAPAPRVRFGAWSRGRGRRSAGRILRGAAARPSAAEIPERNDADDTACVFCTSGTTARPKIVVYDHAAYWLNGLDTLEFLGLTETTARWNTARSAGIRRRC